MEYMFSCAVQSYFSLENFVVLAQQNSGYLCMSLLSQSSVKGKLWDVLLMLTG